MMSRMIPLSALLVIGSLAFAHEGEVPGPSDAQIAHIVVTANSVDVDAGKLARSVSRNPEVRKFAEQMVTDHTAVNQQAAALAKKLGVSPQDNDTSKSLKKGGDENIAKLKKLKGEKFDREYVSNEVTYHEAVLGAIDQVLIPSAKNEELKGLIIQVRPAIAAHLEHAKILKKELDGK